MNDADDEGRSEPTQIVLADDHLLFRAALRQMLNGPSYLEVVGEAGDGQEALKLCRRLRPELVLMDVRMPKMDGIEATRAIKREFPFTIVLMLTALDDPDLLLQALKAGASGYVLKHASVQQITEAIRKVLEGESALDQEVAARLFMRLIEEKQQEEGLEDLASLKPSEERPTCRSGESLTPREVQVLRLMARGQTNQEIANKLVISVSTVKNHVHRIIMKLGASDRVQAATLAIKHGVISS